LAEVLTQDEIDALLAQLEGGTLDLSGPKPDKDKAKPQVRIYDFRRPDKFSRNQMRTLQMLYDHFARLVTSGLSARFRTPVKVTTASVDQITYEEFSGSLPNPGVIGVIAFSGLEGNAVLSISPDIAFPMLDRVFGGPGTSFESKRALTEIEQTVVTSIFRDLMGYLNEAWKSIVELGATLESVQTNPMFVQIVAPNEMTVVISLDIRVGDQLGTLSLCLPYLVVEPVLPKLTSKQWFAKMARGVGPDARRRLEQKLGTARVVLRVELGKTEITVGELLELTVGDVIELDQRVYEDLQVYVGQRVKFEGRPGRVGPRLALEISGLVEEGEDHTSE